MTKIKIEDSYLGVAKQILADFVTSLSGENVPEVFNHLTLLSSLEDQNHPIYSIFMLETGTDDFSLPPTSIQISSESDLSLTAASAAESSSSSSSLPSVHSINSPLSSIGAALIVEKARDLIKRWRANLKEGDTIDKFSSIDAVRTNGWALSESHNR